MVWLRHSGGTLRPQRAKLDRLVERHKAGTLTNNLNNGCTDWTKFENNEIKGAVSVKDK